MLALSPDLTSIAESALSIYSSATTSNSGDLWDQPDDSYSVSTLLSPPLDDLEETLSCDTDNNSFSDQLDDIGENQWPRQDDWLIPDALLPYPLDRPASLSRFRLDTDFLGDTLSSTLVSPPLMDTREMAPDGLVSFHGSSTPLSPTLDRDIEFLNGALPTMSASSLAYGASASGAFEEQLLGKMDEIVAALPLHPAFQSGTRLPEPINDLMTETSENCRGEGHQPTAPPADLESGMVESLPSGLVAPCKPQTIRIVVKVPKNLAENEEHQVDCLLDKWRDSAGKVWFYVRWFDKSCSWEPEEHILDDNLIEDLEKRHGGLGRGVEVVRTHRAQGGKVKYRVHFLGRPKKEDEWVAEKYLCSELVKKHRPEKKRKRGRRA